MVGRARPERGEVARLRAGVNGHLVMGVARARVISGRRKGRRLGRSNPSLWQSLGAAALICVVLVFGLRQARAADWLIDPKPFVAKVTARADGSAIELANGLIRRVIALRPNAATVAFDNLMTGDSMLRATRPEARIELGGKWFEVGGLAGQPIQNFLEPKWLPGLTAVPGAFRFVRYETGRTVARFPWKQRTEWLSRSAAWPPPGASLTLVFEAPAGAEPVTVEVHYEIYDGLPLLAKWLVVRNGSASPVMLNAFTVEQLAFVEPESIVDGSAANFRGAYRSLEAFSDYAFGGNMSANADAPAIHWPNDPLYTTQVHYERQTPCLLECFPATGPEVEITPGQLLNPSASLNWCRIPPSASAGAWRSGARTAPWRRGCRRTRSSCTCAARDRTR